MSVIADIENKRSSFRNRSGPTKLADRLIASLPPDFTYEEEIEEALRRSREMDEDPSKALAFERFHER